MSELPDWATGLGLQRHPEGGWFSETWRSGTRVTGAALGDYPGDRALATAILFMLLPGESSTWHRVRSDELWFHHCGGAIELSLGGDAVDGPTEVTTQALRPDVLAGQLPQRLVPAGHWQAARPLGDDPVLVSCVVSPGFDFEDFTLLAE